MGRARLSERMEIALFCRTYGLTYEEYLAQPTWLLERFRIMSEADAKGEGGPEK